MYTPLQKKFHMPKALRCETNQPFQQWNITVPQFHFSELRLVTAYGVPEITPLRSNYTIFNFTCESVSPQLLVASLAIINATTDISVSCVDYAGSASSVNHISLTAG